MNVALIGCGGIAEAHLTVFKNLKKTEIIGVCDLDKKRAEKMAHRFKVKNVFTDYNELFEMKDLEMVDICTPISTHAKIICDAAKKVPYIFVEKPMALNTTQCDDVINALEKYNSKLCVSHQQIFYPPVMKLKSLVDKGELQIASFSTKQKESFEALKENDLAADWMVAPQQGGILLEVCSHLAYLQLHFLPDISEIYAVGNKVKYPVYDNFSVLLRTKSGPYGLIDLSWASVEPEITYELCDKTGRRIQIFRDFLLYEEKLPIHHFSPSGVVSSFFTEEIRTLRKWANFGYNFLQKRRLLAHHMLIMKYIESIEEGLPSPITPEDGKKTIQLLECIKKSLDKKQPVPFN